jgi:RND superfamily putative drug exporter
VTGCRPPRGHQLGALIMVAVFLGFAFDPAVVIKMMGIGLATAIADATLVRLVLVPATMALLGDRMVPPDGWTGSCPT